MDGAPARYAAIREAAVRETAVRSVEVPGSGVPDVDAHDIDVPDAIDPDFAAWRSAQGAAARRRSRITRRLFLAGGLGAFAAGGAAGAWALNRYVIAHVEVDHASARRATKVSPAAVARNGAWTATTYRSDTAAISISTHERGAGADKIVYFVADVKVSDATILRSAFAHDQFGRNISADTSEIAAGVKAVLAINGDFYGFRDNGIVLRNGVAYRDKGVRQGLALYANGSVELYDETRTSAAKLIDAGVWNTISFGPGLVRDGRILQGIDQYEIGDFGPVGGVGGQVSQPGLSSDVPGSGGNGGLKPGSIQGYQPRTGLGVVGRNHFVMIVVSGRGANGSRGATMSEFARMFVDAGAKLAYNLDGGGSATMVFHDKLVNTPAWIGGSQRSTSDIFYIAG